MHKNYHYMTDEEIALLDDSIVTALDDSIPEEGQEFFKFMITTLAVTWHINDLNLCEEAGVSVRAKPVPSYAFRVMKALEMTGIFPNVKKVKQSLLKLD